MEIQRTKKVKDGVLDLYYKIKNKKPVSCIINITHELNGVLTRPERLREITNLDSGQLLEIRQDINCWQNYYDSNEEYFEETKIMLKELFDELLTKRQQHIDYLQKCLKDSSYPIPKEKLEKMLQEELKK